MERARVDIGEGTSRIENGVGVERRRSSKREPVAGLLIVRLLSGSKDQKYVEPFLGMVETRV